MEEESNYLLFSHNCELHIMLNACKLSTSFHLSILLLPTSVPPFIKKKYPSLKVFAMWQLRKTMQKKDEQLRKLIFQEGNKNQEKGRGLVSLEFIWMPKGSNFIQCNYSVFRKVVAVTFQSTFHSEKCIKIIFFIF
jgi:hypothetical protein